MRIQLHRASLKKDEEPTINLTSLLDVVFLILILFIVMAPLLEMEKVELANTSPKAKSVPSHQLKPIVLHVQQNNSIQFNQEKISKETLQEKLKEAKTLFPHSPLQLFHDKEASFGTYQFVKNSAEKAGFQEMELILKPSTN